MYAAAERRPTAIQSATNMMLVTLVDYDMPQPNDLYRPAAVGGCAMCCLPLQAIPFERRTVSGPPDSA